MSKNIIPVCGKWDWVSKKQEDGVEISFPVACWVYDSDTGHATGLVALDQNFGGNQKDITNSDVTRLVGPPPIAGRYVRVE